VQRGIVMRIAMVMVMQAILFLLAPHLPDTLVLQVTATTTQQPFVQMLRRFATTSTTTVQQELTKVLMSIMMVSQHAKAIATTIAPSFTLEHLKFVTEQTKIVTEALTKVTMQITMVIPLAVVTATITTLLFVRMLPKHAIPQMMIAMVL
jgi:hypothetical protein